MLNQALRRTSGSNVQVIHAMSRAGGPVALVELHRPPDPAVLDAGQDAGDVAVQGVARP